MKAIQAGSWYILCNSWHSCHEIDVHRRLACPLRLRTYLYAMRYFDVVQNLIKQHQPRACPQTARVSLRPVCVSLALHRREYLCRVQTQ